MTSAWVVSVRLQRRFRRLLIVYPRGYRRRHGDEILTTLMEAAESGRERPTPAEVRDLVLSGLRQRFRLPVGRLVVLAAVLTAVTAGGVGVALGSAAGWATAARLPADPAARGLVALATGEDYRDGLRRDGGPLGLQPTAAMPAPVFPSGWTPAAAQARLAAAGWSVDPFDTQLSTNTHYVGKADGPTDDPSGARRAGNAGSVVQPVPTELTMMVAERDGMLLRVDAFIIRGGPADLRDRAQVQVFVQPAEPAAALPLAVAGGLLGLLAGWLVAARVGYRQRRQPPLRRLPLLAAAAGAMVILAPLTVGTYRLVIRAIAAAAGPDPVGYARFEILPASYQYAHNLTAGWNAATGLAAALLVVVISLALRPPPPAEPAVS